LKGALKEAREEAERWKDRLKECDGVRKGIEGEVEKEKKRGDALKAELTQCVEDLEKAYESGL